MSARTRKADREVRIRKEMEANNAKSPDIPTVTLTAMSVGSAIRVAEIFEEVTKTNLPSHFNNWNKTLEVPTELYFVFDTQKQKQKFLRRAYKELGIAR